MPDWLAWGITVGFLFVAWVAEFWRKRYMALGDECMRYSNPRACPPLVAEFARRRGKEVGEYVPGIVDEMSDPIGRAIKNLRYASCRDEWQGHLGLLHTTIRSLEEIS